MKNWNFLPFWFYSVTSTVCTWLLQYAEMNASTVTSSGMGTHLMCNYCNYTSPKRYLLTRHMKAHSEERPHKCTICSRMFKTIPALQNHINTHTGVRPQHCKVIFIDWFIHSFTSASNILLSVSVLLHCWQGIRHGSHPVENTDGSAVSFIVDCDK